MNYYMYIYIYISACTIGISLSHKISRGIQYPRQTVHINHRIQADPAYNCILFMRPHGINASLFLQKNRIALLYRQWESHYRLYFSHHFGARKFRAKLWSIGNNLKQKPQSMILSTCLTPPPLFFLTFHFSSVQFFLCSMDFYNMSPISNYNRVQMINT